VSSSDCPFGIARLDTRVAAAGTVAQLRGTLPSEGTGKAKVTPRFTADVSLSRLARDREPLLAVRVRRVE
jgi:hypothetical protein